jgi:alkylhydroperoxidase family enzyme
MPRLPKTTRADFPEELGYVWDRLGGDSAPNIYKTLGNNPVLLRGYVRLGNNLWNHCGLDVATRELAILRTAILHHSVYEWHQHVRIGSEAGLTLDRIRALHHWRTSEAFSEPERALLAYVDALDASDHPAQDVHDELARHFPPSTLVGINLLIGYYGMTARFLAAMEVETEGPFVGWEPD